MKYKKIVVITYIIITASLLFILFNGWGYDDPYITYRYSKNLAHGFGFVYNLGQKTLSTTTPLFTILLAIISIVWDNIPKAAVLVGCLSISISGYIFYKIAELWKTPWVGYVGLLLYPTFPLVISTISSETPLYIALVLISFYFYLKKDFVTTGIVSSLLVLIRPDGILVPAILFSHHLITERKLYKNEIAGVLIFTFITGIWFTFSWIYFGDPLPVTLSVKQSQGNMAISQKFAEGLITILKPYNRFPYMATFSLATFGLFYSIFRKKTPLLFISWACLYFLAYSILGVSRYFWYYAPLVSGFIVLIGLGLEWLNEQTKTIKPLLIIFLIISLSFQFKDIWTLHYAPDNRLAIYKEAGEWLNKYTEINSTIGLLEVGIIGYYSNRTMIDFAGLIQPEISKIFTSNSTYEDAALYTLQKYIPNYVVLHDGLFPQVEKVIVYCTKEITFEGSSYNYPLNITIYKCH